MTLAIILGALGALLLLTIIILAIVFGRRAKPNTQLKQSSGIATERHQLQPKAQNNHGADAKATLIRATQSLIYQQNIDAQDDGHLRSKTPAWLMMLLQYPIEE